MACFGGGFRCPRFGLLSSRCIYKTRIIRTYTAKLPCVKYSTSFRHFTWSLWFLSLLLQLKIKPNHNEKLSYRWQTSRRICAMFHVVADPLEIHLSPYNYVEFVRSRSNGASVITEIRLKNMNPCVPPFKVTQRNWHRSIGYLGLYINFP